MMGPIGAVKRKGFELDPRLVQLQDELTMAEQQPNLVGLQFQDEENGLEAAQAPEDSSAMAASWEASKKSRIMGELDQDPSALRGPTDENWSSLEAAEDPNALGGLNDVNWSSLDDLVLAAAAEAAVAETDLAAAAAAAAAASAEAAAGEPGERRRSYKTQLCRFYPLGSCQKGAACNFAHGEHELMTHAGGNLMSELGGEPKVMRCFKTQLCKFYVMGNCGKGLACTFAHGESEVNHAGAGGAGGDAMAAAMANAAMAGAMGGCMGGYMGAAMGGGAMGGCGMGGCLGADIQAKQAPPRAYKTQLCKFYQGGGCQKGENCNYAHGEEELAAGAALAGGGVSAPAASAGVPLAFQGLAEARSSGQRARKTVPCRFFQIGKCNKGDQCSFAHDESELPPGSQALQAAAAQAAAAAAGPAMGALPDGQSWAQQPYSGSGGGKGSKYKTVLCKYYASGRCQKGSQCTFSHGEAGGSFDCGGGFFGKGGCGDGSDGWAGDAWGKGSDAWGKGSSPWGMGCDPSWGKGCDPWGKGGDAWAKGADSSWAKGGCKGWAADWASAGSWAAKGGAMGVAALPALGTESAEGEEDLVSQLLRAETEEAQEGGGCAAPAVGEGRYYKSQLCRFYAAGQCSKGPECSFAHGEEELRPAGSGKG